VAQTERQGYLFNADLAKDNPFTEALKTETDKLATFTGRGTPAQRKAARIAKRADMKEMRRQRRLNAKYDRLDKKGYRKAKRAQKRYEGQQRRGYKEEKWGESGSGPPTGYTPILRPVYSMPTFDIFDAPSMKEGELFFIGPGQQEMGWQNTLTQAPDSNKHAGSGHLDYTVEAYATQETRKENWDQPFVALSGHPSTPTLNPSYKQMYKEVETKGFANKIVKKYFT
jgi:hypothetical protein